MVGYHNCRLSGRGYQRIGTASALPLPFSIPRRRLQDGRIKTCKGVSREQCQIIRTSCTIENHGCLWRSRNLSCSPITHLSRLVFHSWIRKLLLRRTAWAAHKDIRNELNSHITPSSAMIFLFCQTATARLPNCRTRLPSFICETAPNPPTLDRRRGSRRERTVDR